MGWACYVVELVLANVSVCDRYQMKLKTAPLLTQATTTAVRLRTLFPPLSSPSAQKKEKIYNTTRQTHPRSCLPYLPFSVISAKKRVRRTLGVARGETHTYMARCGRGELMCMLFF